MCLEGVGRPQYNAISYTIVLALCGVAILPCVHAAEISALGGLRPAVNQSDFWVCKSPIYQRSINGFRSVAQIEICSWYVQVNSHLCLADKSVKFPMPRRRFDDNCDLCCIAYLVAIQGLMREKIRIFRGGAWKTQGFARGGPSSPCPTTFRSSHHPVCPRNRRQSDRVTMV